MTWLTSEQLAAVSTTARVAVVRAAPGSGKTLVLTERIRHLIASGIAPDRILALTFTRRAARELSERTSVTALTFHAFCVSLIAEHANLPGFTIRDEEEVGALERAVRDELGKRAADSQVRARVRARLRELNAVSYDDVEDLGVQLAPKCSFSHVVIDEAQDTSERQQALVRAIGASSQLFAGDFAQAIFTWRGAHPEGFIALCDGAEVYDLSLNCRSGAEIAAAASRLAARMTPPGLVQRTRPERGQGSVGLIDWLPDDVAGQPPGECAVLCRTWDEARYAAEQLADAGIPYVVAGGAGDWGAPGTRRLIAALRLRANPNDHLSLHTLSRGHGLSSLDVANAVRVAARNGISVLDAVSGGKVGTWMQMGIPELCEALHVPAALGLDAMTADEVFAAHAEAFAQGLPPQLAAVLITTVHSAKGAEWANVWVVGFDRDCSERAREEQRRLLYVALTRGRDRVRFVVRDEMGALLREAVSA